MLVIHRVVERVCGPRDAFTRRVAHRPVSVHNHGAFAGILCDHYRARIERVAVRVRVVGEDVDAD